MKKYLLKALFTGTQKMEIEDKSYVMVVSALCILTILLAALGGLIIFFSSWDYSILTASLFEIFLFAAILCLNYTGKHAVARYLFLLIHCIAVVYFTIWRQMLIDEFCLTIFLCITSVLVFKPVKQAIVSVGAVTFIFMVSLIISQQHIVNSENIHAEGLYHKLGLTSIGIMLLSAILLAKSCTAILSRALNLNTEQIESIIKERTNNVKYFTRIQFHDVKTELSAQLLKTGEIVDPTFSRNLVVKGSGEELRLNEVIKSAHAGYLRLESIVGNLLDYAKIEKGTYFSVNNECINFRKWLSELVSVMTLIAEDKPVAIDHSVDADLPESILTDSKLLSHAVRNLISNAIKFTPKNGQVLIRAYKDTENMLWLEVKDEGKGIPADKIDSLFEPYMTDGTGGNGLGLALVKEVINKMNGYIDVESYLGQGSAFRVAVPLDHCIEKKVTSMQEEFLPYSNLGDQFKVLIVDDNEMNLKSLYHIVKELGCQPIMADSATLCMELLPLWRPKLLLLDARLPDINGPLLLKAIRKLDNQDIAEVPVVIVSADDSEELRNEFRPYCPEAFISKPFNRTKAKECLMNLIIRINKNDNDDERSHN